jgi:bifunctional DNase/RNase
MRKATPETPVLSELIPLSFDKIMQTRAYTVIVLGARDKRFAIYTEAVVGKNLQLYLTQTDKQRPLTHDLINSMLKGLNARVRQVVINDVIDTVYYARLYLEYYEDELLHIIEIDARPSDCIVLALMNDAPVYCTYEVLDKTVPIDD